MWFGFVIQHTLFFIKKNLNVLRPQTGHVFRKKLALQTETLLVNIEIACSMSQKKFRCEKKIQDFMLSFQVTCKPISLTGFFSVAAS